MFVTFRQLCPIFFDAPADGGGGGDPAPAPAPAGDPAPVADAGSVPAPAGDPAPVTEPAVTEPPNWEAKVTEWGGEDAVARALRIDAALGTTEGQNELIRQGLTQRGFNAAQIDAFLASNTPPPVVEQGETIEQLLADPDRVLTAAEIQRVLTARDEQANTQRTNEQIVASATATIGKVFTELNVPAVNQKTILTIADGFLPQPGIIPADTAVVEAAIRRGAAEFEKQVQEAARASIEGKAAVNSGLPSPLPAGGSGGSEQPTEPKNVAEASARVRARHGW